MFNRNRRVLWLIQPVALCSRLPPTAGSVVPFIPGYAAQVKKDPQMFSAFHVSTSKGLEAISQMRIKRRLQDPVYFFISL